MKIRMHLAWYFIAIVLLGLTACDQLKTEENFAMSVFVHGEAGRDVIPLKRDGILTVDLGTEKKSFALNEQGEARITEIPQSLHDKQVKVTLAAAGYELLDPSGIIKLSPENVYLAVRMITLPISGQVQDTKGNIISGAKVSVGQYATQTDENGWYMLKLPRNLPEKDQSLEVSIAGYKPYKIPVLMEEAPQTLILQREK
ncbi:MAG: carboxypeptidase-like regulatory domain-containing protein [Gallionella sp.]|nr:carboxypeptidase-like regulatory domain-containing protein [Gallionella sp.]